MLYLQVAERESQASKLLLAGSIVGYPEADLWCCRADNSSRNLLKKPKFARNRCPTTQYLDRNPLILLETNSAEIKRFGPEEHFSASS
jgi:hypothetical protein